MNFPQASVLVIESHPLMREALCTAILDEPTLCIAGQIPYIEDDFLTAAKARPSIVLFSLEETGRNNLNALVALRKKIPNIPIVALSYIHSSDQENVAQHCDGIKLLSKSGPRSEFIRELIDLSHRSLHGTGNNIE